MNTPIAIEKKKPVKFFLSRWFPESVTGKTFLWAFLPLVLLLLTMGVSFLRPTPFTLYLPVFSAIGVFLCCLWKTIGLSGSYLALISFLLITLKNVPSDQYLWQMVMVLCFAIDYFIVLLSVEEIEITFRKKDEEYHEKLSHLHQSTLEAEQEKRAWEEEKQRFEEEIEKLIAEAELRRIEKQQDNKRFTLIQSEIEMLTAQKEEFIADAFEARKVAKQREAFISENETGQALCENQEKIISLQMALSQPKLLISTEMAHLEEEINCLEELVSHILSRESS